MLEAHERASLGAVLTNKAALSKKAWLRLQSLSLTIR